MQVQLSVPLSHLESGKRNPRRVRPSREAHHRLVALIRSQGLIQPLVVRPVEDKPKHYRVIAGNRRLSALKEIHRNDGDPKVPCILRDVDAVTADALSLGENFAREPMHPQDEAEAFAKLASGEGKGAKAIASEFGVTEHYVRQRMKLATLAEPVKAAYRDGKLDTATAEAFAGVPEDRQLEVWKEVGGNPRHAEHVKNVIAHAWIDASHARFDISALAESAVSRDLFGDRVLVERQAFFDAQAKALLAEREAMTQDGWAEVVVGRREDVQDRLYSMNLPEREFGDETKKKLARIERRRLKLEAAAEKVAGDDKRISRLQERYGELEDEEQEVIRSAPPFFSEETKAVATAFLILDPDGRVHCEYRVQRKQQRSHSNGNGHDSGGGCDPVEVPKPPTPEELSDRQLSTVFTHQALAVRDALLKNDKARKRVLALILHDKVRSEALAVHHEANGTTLHATQGEGFTSKAFERLKEKRAKLDPFVDKPYVDDSEAYARLSELSDAKLDALIDVLTVETLTAHMLRKTDLVSRLGKELKVNAREDWTPEVTWLSSYQKIQLAALLTELVGAVHAPSTDKKKWELVETLNLLFTDAAEGRLEDKKLAERVNAWVPAILSEEGREH